VHHRLALRRVEADQQRVGASLRGPGDVGLLVRRVVLRAAQRCLRFVVEQQRAGRGRGLVPAPRPVVRHGLVPVGLDLAGRCGLVVVPRGDHERQARRRAVVRGGGPDGRAGGGG